ncbi:MAG: DivIVA domain-containing protein, partial [Deltaproteobacteria bacterium]|nr:DivIVA domain-containing protein [Deltaproteobacteria bacterium]
EEVSEIITSLIKEKNALKDQLVGYKARLADLKKREEEEKNALKDQLVSYKARLADLKKREEEFREVLTSAHKLSEKMKSQTEKDAELMLERAKLDAERIVADAHQEAVQLEERIMGLRRVHRETAYKIRSVLEGYLRVIDEEALPPEEVDQTINLAATEIRTIQEVLGDLSEGTNAAINNGEEISRVNRPFLPDILEESVNEGGHENDSREERPG